MPIALQVANHGKRRRTRRRWSQPWRFNPSLTRNYAVGSTPHLDLLPAPSGEGVRVKGKHSVKQATCSRSRRLLSIAFLRVAAVTLSLALLFLAAACQTVSSLREAQDTFNRAAAADQLFPRDRALLQAMPGLIKSDQAYQKNPGAQTAGRDRTIARQRQRRSRRCAGGARVGGSGSSCGTDRAHLVTTTRRPEEIGSLSSPTGGEGWGEEAHSTGCPSPRSFLAGRGRRRFPVLVTRCARTDPRCPS